MTTGRINQVTTVPRTRAVPSSRSSPSIKKCYPPFERAGGSFTMIKHLRGASSEPPSATPSNSDLTPLSLVPPVSHIFQVGSPTSRRRRSPPSMRTTSDRRRSIERLTVTADPRVVNRFWLGHQQSIHTLRPTLTLPPQWRY